jgi:hypothetical protein
VTPAGAASGPSLSLPLPAQVGLIPASVVDHAGLTVGVGRAGAEWRVVAEAPATADALQAFEGEVCRSADGVARVVGPASARNAAAVRAALPWLAPRPIGLHTSAGFGDRLGLATPGHVRALQAAPGVVPVFAQQSIREMTRTGRGPQDVIDAATWGALAAGWRGPVGADADHLKTIADLECCAAAGYSLFTIDPGEHVDPMADSAEAATLRARFAELPWPALEDDEASLRGRYIGRPLEIDGGRVEVDEAALVRAAVKYGRAVAHVAAMYRHLVSLRPASSFELEVSVDETDTPTSAAEHVYVAVELRRLGVRWVSLAPRFVGRFEKGVDYIGDLAAFRADLAVHAAIARALGPYKLSLHSGSDKFSLYPAFAEATRGLAHLKTAGTSYLEALRTVAIVAPALLLEIYAFARERYPEDRASYHVSASLDAAPAPHHVAGPDAAALLDQFDAREILHVTFGSVLTARDASGGLRFAGRLRAELEREPEAYASCLARHFTRHLAPFAAVVV